MRSRTSNWFEGKIRYEKTNEDGLTKKVTEQYVVNAYTFTEAESNLTDDMKPYIIGEFEITDLKKAAYTEIFFSEEEKADKWYKAKVNFIMLDEYGKEKRSAVHYLVQAGSLQGAIKNIDEVMKGTMTDYESCSVQETKIMDVFEYAKNTKATT